MTTETEKAVPLTEADAYARTPAVVVFSELDDEGRTILYAHLEVNGDLADVVLRAEQAAEDLGLTDPAIQVTFRLMDAIDGVLTGAEIIGEPGLFDLSAKPLMDAMRGELLAMLARIDGIKYTDEPCS